VGAWLLGGSKASRDNLYQFVVLPSQVNKATLSFKLKVSAPSSTQAKDTLSVELVGSSGAAEPVATFSNLDATPDYVTRTYDVSSVKGTVVVLLFRARGTGELGTTFVLDDISLVVE
jgi:xanthomonalisin